MPHGAFNLVDVIAGIDDKLTCITYNGAPNSPSRKSLTMASQGVLVPIPLPEACYFTAGDNVYLGTFSGKLLWYRVVSATVAGKVEYRSERVVAPVDSGSKKPVTQIEAIPDLNLLLVLVDGCMSMWDLEPFRKKASGVLDTKNVQSFAINVRGPPKYKLCVCVVSGRKRLRLYDWDAPGKYEFFKELDLPDAPRTIAYVGSRLFLGYQREYNICYDNTGEVVDLAAPLGRDTRPYVKCLPKDKVLLITAEDLGITVTATGEPSPEPPVRFGHHPLSLAYCYPYIISASDSSSTLEIHAARTGGKTSSGKDELVQSIPVPLGAAGTDFDETSKGRNPVYIAFSTPAKVCRLQPVPVDRQVEEMLRNFQIAAALDLLANTCNDQAIYAVKRNRLQIDAGRVLFYGLHFEAAFHHLSLSAVDPREVLNMFPDLLISAAAVKASLSLEPPVGSIPPEMLAVAFDYQSKYFNASLTEGIVTGLKIPSDGASEAADSLTIDSSRGTGAALITTPSSTDDNALALEPGVRTGMADVNVLIRRQLPLYVKRMTDEGFPRLEGGPAMPPPKLAAIATVEERLAAAWDGLIKFLRQRRAIVHDALKGESDPHTAVSSTDISLTVSAGAGTQQPSSSGAAVSGFDVRGWSTEELEGLALALDTALVKLFDKTHRWQHLDRLVFKSPYLDLVDTSSYLHAVGRHHSVALLYQGRAMPREALTVWRDLGLEVKTEYKEPPFHSRSDDAHLGPRERSDSMSDDDVDCAGAAITATSGIRRAQDGLAASEPVNEMPTAIANAALRFPPALFPETTISAVSKYDGVDDTVALLRLEGSVDIVKEFAEWMLLRYPAPAMEVFTHRLHELNPDAVLEYFAAEQFASAAKRSPATAPTRLFLEHLVFQLGHEEDRYHTQLAREYIAGVIQLRGLAPIVRTAIMPKSSMAKSLDPDNVMDTAEVLSGTFRERPWPGSEGGMLGELRGKLIRLLQESSFYDASTILTLVRDTSLYEEQIIIYARLGEHEQALYILVNTLADHEQAIRYCSLISKQRFGEGRWSDCDAPEQPVPVQGGGPRIGASGVRSAPKNSLDPFIMLVGLYLEADASYWQDQQALGNVIDRRISIYLDRALDVLSKHADRIDPLSVAKLLPQDLKLHQLLPYWEVVVPASAHAAREAGVVRHLYRDTHIAVNYELVTKQARSVEISRTTYCFVCDKRINDSVFSILPDNRPIHFGCLRELNNTFGAALSHIDHEYGSKRLGFSSACTRATLYNALTEPSKSNALCIYPGSTRPPLKALLSGHQYRPVPQASQEVYFRTAGIETNTPDVSQYITTKQLRFAPPRTATATVGNPFSAIGSALGVIASAPLALVGGVGEVLSSAAMGARSAAESGIKAFQGQDRSILGDSRVNMRR